MDLYVGQTSLKGDFRRYAKQLNYVELLAEPQQLPGLKKVAELAAASRASVEFGVVLSPRYWSADSDSIEAYCKKVVQACDASWVIIRTPPAMRPGTGTEAKLARLVEAWRPELGGRRLAWEPRGLWQPRMVNRVAEQLSIIPVWDLMALPAGSLGEDEAYVRLAALGVATRVNEGRLERLAVKAQDCKTLHVVVEGKGAVRTRQILQSLLDPFAGLDESTFAPGTDDASSDEAAEASRLTREDVDE